MRVLIVEDEYLIAWAAEMCLEDAGHEVTGIADSFETAVRLAEDTRPDLVLMDIVLTSERDGVDAALAIRERFGIASLFTSANQDHDNMTRASAADPVGWLPKPYAPERLVQRIAEVARPSGSLS